MATKRDKSFERVKAPLDSLDLSGKKVAVVGGTDGLGRAIALAAASRGAQVLVVGRTNRVEGVERVSFLKADLTLMAAAKPCADALPTVRSAACAVALSLLLRLSSAPAHGLLLLLPPSSQRSRTWTSSSSPPASWPRPSARCGRWRLRRVVRAGGCLPARRTSSSISVPSAGDGRGPGARHGCELPLAPGHPGCLRAPPARRRRRRPGSLEGLCHGVSAGFCCMLL